MMAEAGVPPVQQPGQTGPVRREGLQPPEWTHAAPPLPGPGAGVVTLQALTR